MADKTGTMPEETPEPPEESRGQEAGRGSGATPSRGPKARVEPADAASGEDGRDEGAERAEGRFSRAAGRAVGTAASGAAGASRSFVDGFSAMRDVHRASRQRSSARSRLQSIQDALDEDQATLGHRTDVEANFASIVAEQTEALAEARAAVADAQARIDALDGEHGSLSAKLDQMRKDHERELRPYKNLMESTRSRADDASKRLAEARRAVRTAEGQVGDATTRREQRIASANHAVDNAQARLQKLQGELADMQRSPSTGMQVLSDMKGEVAAELAHLESARADVSSVSDETQRAVDNAQTHLWTQKQSLELCEKQSEDAKAEARTRKEEYDKLFQDAQTEEATLDNAVVQREMDVRDVTKEQRAAQDRADAAQAALDDANEIHETPDATRELRDKVADEGAALEAQQRQVDSLAKSEQALRERTRRERVVFVCIVVAVVLVVLIAAWLASGTGAS